MDENKKQEEANSLLYIFPLFFGILGGLFMYLIVSKQDERMAKQGIVFGAFTTIIYVIIVWIIL